MTKNMEKKYIPLANFFQVTTQNEITLSFSALENIIGQSLPNAAYLNSSWWKKTKPPLSHYLSWTDSGFYVVDVKLGTSVTFSRNYTRSSTSQVPENNENSNAYIIRTIEASDAKAFITLQEEIFHETEYMYNAPNELELTVQQLRKDLISWKKLKNRTILICILNGAFAGYAVIHGYKHSKAKHVANVHLAVKEMYHRQGIGKTLMEEVESWSKQRAITKLELSVMAHNDSALQFFKKIGFQHEGKRLQSILLNDTLIDECVMGKIVQK
ncbi:GNAT family N-acetyltransferase [Lysinibacillus sp. NPDC096418]|uniref:GNAT family N-acetyltransferase n=1 Tax=Lysinibacillus sp. NPDC096418 TaxID=3364138 RepID=UPI00382170AF